MISTLEEQIAAEIAGLKALDLHELRLRWRKLFRSSAPAHLPKYLLFRIIAYKIQANAFGDLDRETVRYLDRIAKDYEEERGGRDALAQEATADPSCSERPVPESWNDPRPRA